MTLKLYNTLTREKADFVPLDPANVRMYVCGPTVYDFAHIGNARPVIVFDVLFRLLRHLYGTDHVTYARNVTDVDDKIIARAAEEGVSIEELTKRTERQFHEDVAALGCLPPTIEPRATEHIGQMIDMIGRLIDRGFAYEAEGHVLFHVPAMPDYGRLARRTLDEMQAGARVEVAPYKRDPMDFVLWKPARQEAGSAAGATGKHQEAGSAAGSTGWDSPWGRGRPGWHIECSAMSEAHLGETFDIHGGGIDLVFPHHENEVAQSRCAHGTDVMANVWMHNGFLQVEGEKMSKSLGNFFTIREVLADWPGDVVRLAMLATHYRQPINWTLTGLKEAATVLDGWFGAAAEDADPRPAPGVLEALNDDLNTPRAIAAMHELRNKHSHKGLAGTLAFFGFDRARVENWRASRAPAMEVDEAQVEARIDARISARKARDFAEADRIRDELAGMGVRLKDNPDGTTTWEVAR